MMNGRKIIIIVELVYSTENLARTNKPRELDFYSTRRHPETEIQLEIERHHDLPVARERLMGVGYLRESSSRIVFQES